MPPGGDACLVRFLSAGEGERKRASEPDLTRFLCSHSAKCPFDTGSQWKDDKVCFCKGLDTGSGIECSAGRKFSPVKVAGTLSGNAPGTRKNVDDLNRQYAPMTCGRTEECTCPQAGTPVW